MFYIYKPHVPPVTPPETSTNVYTTQQPVQKVYKVTQISDNTTKTPQYPKRVWREGEREEEREGEGEGGMFVSFFGRVE